MKKLLLLIVSLFCASLSAMERPTTEKGPWLINAIIQGEGAVKVQLLYSIGAHPDATDSSGTPALTLAISTDQYDVVEALLGLGADYEKGDANGLTPLMAAAGLGKITLVELLLAYGAEPYYQTEVGWDALSVALQNQHADCVQILAIAMGLEVQAYDA